MLILWLVKAGLWMSGRNTPLERVLFCHILHLSSSSLGSRKRVEMKAPAAAAAIKCEIVWLE
jgi:hypothetical protein